MDRMIVINSTGREIGYLDYSINVDMDLGNSNDFEFEMKLASWDREKMDYGFIIVLPDTEYGGMVGDIQTVTKNAKAVMTGDTWRGMLAKKIIEPPSGQDYKTVSGELNSVINSLIGSQFGSLFFVSSKNTGISVQNYKFDRYCTLLAGIETMLTSVGYRLDIRYRRGGAGIPGWVELQAVPAEDFSGSKEYNQDNRINFTARDYRRGINHLICAGTGEGADRTVIHLYVQKDGTIGSKKYYTGLDERVALYSYTSQSDAEKLKEDGTKRLKELMNYKQFDMTVEDVDLNIGDIVSGRDYVTGILVQKPVARKILKLKKGKISIEYKLS
jgi:hypothetical protein